MRVTALCGGVGGARMLEGLAQALPPEDLTAIVNTGDDFRHWGLSISPDLDTCMYWLAGLAHEARGWGLERETFEAHQMVERYGGSGWFALGDRDLGTHLMRTQWLGEGHPLTHVTTRLCEGLGVGPTLLPMSDAPHPTVLDTDEGTLDFQTWLVRRRGAPLVRAVRSEGSKTPAPRVLPAIEAADLIVLAPSNPYVSIDPILNLEGVREAVSRRPVVGISPIVCGRAVKGPLAEMIPSLAGEPPSAAAIARHYGDLLDGLVLETGDTCDIPHHATATVMRSASDRRRLAQEVLDFGARATARRPSSPLDRPAKGSLD